MMDWKNALYATFLSTMLCLLIGSSFAAIWLINAKDARDALARGNDVDHHVTSATVPYAGATVPPPGAPEFPHGAPEPPLGVTVPPPVAPVLPGEAPQRKFPPVTSPSTADTNLPAKCSELKSLPQLRLPQLAGKWMLEEKLEFVESSKPQVAIERQDKTTMCMRIELQEVQENLAAVSIVFHVNESLSRNMAGEIKVKEDGYWDFHMLAKDHYGIVIDSDPDKHFTFVECIPARKDSLNNEPANPVDSIIPGSIFLFTRRQLSEAELTEIRKKIEIILRHKDETYIDYGAYCI
ncbi:hypothetical protein B566_EDAN000811 [Ephemera danica]|nr:hypothetical protein B566_EDAN000811 [Ephemera danica]